MLKINEIFFSIQGESSYAGFSTVFVRTSGCHLRCTYCDTTYAYYQGEKKSQDDVLAEIEAHGAEYVCITGGEPLLQKEIFSLMKILCDRGYKVSCETSGAVVCDDVDARVKKIIDVKTPDSGEANSFIMSNLRYADALSEFKFVICTENDFEWAELFCKENSLFEKTNVLYSPSFGKISENWLAKKILSEKSKARLQLQLHKYIWSPHVRGV